MKKIHIGLYTKERDLLLAQYQNVYQHNVIYEFHYFWEEEVHLYDMIIVCDEISLQHLQFVKYRKPLFYTQYLDHQTLWKTVAKYALGISCFWQRVTLFLDAFLFYYDVHFTCFIGMNIIYQLCYMMSFVIAFYFYITYRYFS